MFEQDLLTATETLRKGGIILYPTDTVWGIGCDATNTEAVGKVYALKKRYATKAMLVLIPTPQYLKRYLKHIPMEANKLWEANDCPTTIIYPHPINLASNLISTDDTIGIRITHEPFSQQLCEQLGRPIVSTSANISGEPTPTIYDHISDEVKKKVDFIVRYRQNEENIDTKPSKIIKISKNGKIKVIRA